MGIFELFGLGRKRNDTDSRQEKHVGGIGCRTNGKTDREKLLYEWLTKEVVTDEDARKSDLGDGMWMFEKMFAGRYKPRYLVDDISGTALCFTDDHGILQTVSHDDIDWESLKGIPESTVERARRLYAWFPTWFGKFKDGISKVHWEINPDGRYYMDEDGFGMEPEDEIALFSYLDRRGRPLVKFRYIKDYKELETMEEEAREKLKKKE